MFNFRLMNKAFVLLLMCFVSFLGKSTVLKECKSSGKNTVSIFNKMIFIFSADSADLAVINFLTSQYDTLPIKSTNARTLKLYPNNVYYLQAKLTSAIYHRYCSIGA